MRKIKCINCTTITIIRPILFKSSRNIGIRHNIITINCSSMSRCRITLEKTRKTSIISFIYQDCTACTTIRLITSKISRNNGILKVFDEIECTTGFTCSITSKLTINFNIIDRCKETYCTSPSVIT